MAIYFPNQVPSTGQRAGEAFGGGISSALGALAQQKMSQLQQRNQMSQVSQALESLGLPSQLAALPESLQQTFVKQHLAQPQQQAFADALSSLLGGGTEQQAAAGTQISPQLQQVMGNATQQQTQQPASGIKIPAGLNQQQAMQLAQLGLQKQALSKKEIAEQRKQELAQQKEERKQNFLEQREIDKETKPFYDDIYKEAKAAKNNDKRLDKMESLIKTGKLTHPLFASAIKTISKGIFGVGIDLSALQNPESQQFEKLSNDFIREAKSIFGNRLTDADLNYFLKTVPTLSLSNEGKMQVIQNMRQLNEAAKLKELAMNRIIEANNGRRPRNLVELVDKATSEQIDELAKKFKMPSEPVVPTQSLIGSVVKAIPNLIFG